MAARLKKVKSVSHSIASALHYQYTSYFLPKPSSVQHISFPLKMNGHYLKAVFSSRMQCCNANQHKSSGVQQDLAGAAYFMIRNLWTVTPVGQVFHPCARNFSQPLKGIVSDSNNIFLWHESEDINKKSLFSKFQLIPVLYFQVMHDYVCFTAPIE